jgi:membrane protease YdiL (CAAX protease family)
MPAPASMSLFEIAFLAIFTLAVPALALHTARRVRAGMPTPARDSVFISIIITQLVFLGIALVVARQSQFALWPIPTWNTTAALITAGILAALIIMLALRFKRRDPAADRALEIILPHASTDLPFFALVCLIVAVSEEVVFRGVMMQIIEPRVQSWWLAAGLCTCVFALSHAVQGAWSMIGVVLAAVTIHVLVKESGNLYWAIALHAAYDFLVGVLYVRSIRPRLVKEGSPAVRADPAQSENPPA